MYTPYVNASLASNGNIHSYTKIVGRYYILFGIPVMHYLLGLKYSLPDRNTSKLPLEPSNAVILSPACKYILSDVMTLYTSLPVIALSFNIW
jgi:hypothetical protein